MHDFNIRIPKGCSCSGVNIGDYGNQVELKTPDHILRLGRIGVLEFRETICVDRCIAPAVQALWALGVVTTGCCCGHNQVDGYIGVHQISEWLSVAERLPASGRTVLAFYINSVGRVRRIRAQYVERWTIEVDAATADPDTECVEYSESADAFYLLEGWYECIDNWDAYVRIAVTEGQVSHWMPLPAAPVDSTVKESLTVQPVKAAPDGSLTAAVDAAMVEMQNISPPLRRSECERLIRAALSVLCVQQGGDA